MIQEDCYGTRKRLTFIEEVIARSQSQRVLDVGCGTGENLTRPLAERFPSVAFIGVDSDVRSIDFANAQPPLANLSFARDADGKFDLVIASEVLEHVAQPLEFLKGLREMLVSESSEIVLTVPNGFGPFEIAATVDQIISRSGLRAAVSRLRSLLRRAGVRRRRSPCIGSITTTYAAVNTFAESPHINFFTRRDLTRIAGGAGLEIIEFRGRTLLCGYGLNRMIRGSLIETNVRLADRVTAVSSGWMLVLRPTKRQRRGTEYEPGRYARLRRKLAGVA